MLLDAEQRFLFFFQGSLKVGTRTTSMRYIQADDCGRGVQVSVKLLYSISVLLLLKSWIIRNCKIEIKYYCPQLCNLGTRSEGTSPPGATVTHTKWTWAEDQLKWVRTKRLHGAIVPGPVAAQLWPNSRGLATAGGPTAQTTRERAAGGALGQPQPSYSKFTEIWIHF